MNVSHNRLSKSMQNEYDFRRGPLALTAQAISGNKLFDILDDGRTDNERTDGCWSMVII